MNWDIFGTASRDRLRAMYAADQPCTSWYGHAFKKFDDTRIYCPTCGQTRKVAA